MAFVLRCQATEAAERKSRDAVTPLGDLRAKIQRTAASIMHMEGLNARMAQCRYREELLKRLTAEGQALAAARDTDADAAGTTNMLDDGEEGDDLMDIF